MTAETVSKCLAVIWGPVTTSLVNVCVDLDMRVQPVRDVSVPCGPTLCSYVKRAYWIALFRLHGHTFIA